MSYLRILFLTLLAITVLWVGLLHESIQDHFGYNELLDIIGEEIGEYPFHLSRSWIGRSSVKLMTFIGVVLTISWVLTAGLIVRKRNKK